MRIVTWNSGRGRPEKKLPMLWEAYSPQIVALQEIAKPCGKLAESPIWKGTNERQGSLVWAAAPYELEAIAEFVCETELYVAARVRHQGLCVFNIVNLWVKPYLNLPRGRCPYGHSLDTALSQAMKLLGDEVTVVLGDTNILKPGSKDYYREFLGDCGLFSGYHEHFHEAAGGETRPTHHHRVHKRDYHIDFCFLPSGWQHGLRVVTVGSPTEWDKRSDHFPIVVDIDDNVVFRGKWFVTRDNKAKRGPFTLDKLKELAASGGDLDPTDMILAEGTRKWVPAQSILGIWNPANPRQAT
jgi:exonuclease III